MLAIEKLLNTTLSEIVYLEKTSTMYFEYSYEFTQRNFALSNKKLEGI